ncbi:class I lanthipeptide [Pedobacter sp. WC2423]|uniref:class I lanthipeptide n=1 Tax=Pedobacter sp. WC2423 TaxID=3234142 RepID=UPI003464F6A3
MESNSEKSPGKKVVLKKTVISVLNEEDLALVTGGVKPEPYLWTTSFVSCTGTLCCDGTKTVVPND